MTWGTGHEPHVADSNSNAVAARRIVIVFVFFCRSHTFSDSDSTLWRSSSVSAVVETVGSTRTHAAHTMQVLIRLCPLDRPSAPRFEVGPQLPALSATPPFTQPQLLTKCLYVMAHRGCEFCGRRREVSRQRVSVCGEGLGCSQMFEVSMETRIAELKQAVASRLGPELGPIKELVFMNERCEDSLSLAHFGLNQQFIRQVAGFAIDPPEPGMKFIDGRLVAWDTPEPDYDRFDV